MHAAAAERKIRKDLEFVVLARLSRLDGGAVVPPRCFCCYALFPYHLRGPQALAAHDTKLR